MKIVNEDIYPALQSAFTFGPQYLANIKKSLVNNVANPIRNSIPIDTRQRFANKLDNAANATTNFMLTPQNKYINAANNILGAAYQTYVAQKGIQPEITGVDNNLINHGPLAGAYAANKFAGWLRK